MQLAAKSFVLLTCTSVVHAFVLPSNVNKDGASLRELKGENLKAEPLNFVKKHSPLDTNSSSAFNPFAFGITLGLCAVMIAGGAPTASAGVRKTGSYVEPVTETQTLHEKERKAAWAKQKREVDFSHGSSDLGNNIVEDHHHKKSLLLQTDVGEKLDATKFETQILQKTHGQHGRQETGNVVENDNHKQGLQRRGVGTIQDVEEVDLPLPGIGGLPNAVDSKSSLHYSIADGLIESSDDSDDSLIMEVAMIPV